MKSPSPISRSTVVAAINRNSYEDMVNIYRKYGLGEPSYQMYRYYMRVKNKDDSTKPERMESGSLSMLLVAITNHPSHQRRMSAMNDIYTQLAEVV